MKPFNAFGNRILFVLGWGQLSKKRIYSELLVSTTSIIDCNSKCTFHTTSDSAWSSAYFTRRKKFDRKNGSIIGFSFNWIITTNRLLYFNDIFDMIHIDISQYSVWPSFSLDLWRVITLFEPFFRWWYFYLDLNLYSLPYYCHIITSFMSHRSFVRHGFCVDSLEKERRNHLGLCVFSRSVFSIEWVWCPERA